MAPLPEKPAIRPDPTGPEPAIQTSSQLSLDEALEVRPAGEGANPEIGEDTTAGTSESLSEAVPAVDRGAGAAGAAEPQLQGWRLIENAGAARNVPTQTRRSGSCRTANCGTQTETSV